MGQVRNHGRSRPRRGVAVLAVLGLIALMMTAVQPANAQVDGGIAAERGRVSTGLMERSLSIAANDSVAIDAVAAGDSAKLLADLEALGLTGGAVAGGLVSGVLPAGSVGDLASLASLHSVHEALYTTNVGDVTSQGDLALQANDARSTYGVDGTGVSIGTLSDSYDCLGGAAGDVTDNDLPGGVVVLDDSACPASDEGRAMMQLIHDSAPGSSQLFHTAFGGQAVFASGIGDLATAGADIIVDDIFYFAEPFFQDGAIAQAVDAVDAAGIAYFSSAGNSADNSYESGLNPLASDPIFGAAYGMHDFDTGAGVDTRQGLTVPVGATATISFQWDQPFGSVSGAPGATTDIDIAVIDNTGALVATSVIINVGGDPLEIVQFTNTTGSTSFELLVGKFLSAGGPNPGIKYVMFGGSPAEHVTNSSTVVGHANAEGAMGVAAAFYADTPEFGVVPALPEPFTSLGGTPILFDTAGNPVSETRESPAFTAPDGGNTTFFGIDVEPDGFPNFFGTSASAPAAAAVAALMLDADPTLTPSAIRTVLEDTSLDMETPGYDFLTGTGLIEAAVAVGTVISNPTCNGLAVTVNLNLGQVPTGGDDVILGTPGDDFIAALGGNDTVCAGDGDDTVIGAAGNDDILGGNGDDLLGGNAGNDRIEGEEGNDAVFGGSGIDIVGGGNGMDRVGGGSGSDRVYGDADGDVLSGGSDSDTEVLGGDGDDAVNGGGGDDSNVQGEEGNDSVSGNGGDDSINGGPGNDDVRGGPGDDFVFGDAGNDFVAGNDGIDTCDGGSGGGDSAAGNCETVVNVP